MKNGSNNHAGDQPTSINTKDAIAIAAGLPADLFFDLLIKLNFKNLSLYLIEMIHQYPEHLKIKLLSNTAKQTWKSLLKLLNEMDSSIPIEAPAEQKSYAWWYFRAVMQASYTIFQRQNEEIDYLKRRHDQLANIDIQEFSADDVTLAQLIERHQQLDAFNSSIIRSKIDRRSSKRLNLLSSAITRIPESIFRDESLIDYWKNVIKFDCRYNLLQQLPDSISNLVSLEELFCSGNKLIQLPRTIGNLIALRTLECSYNRLQQLPDTIGDLAKLCFLDCTTNQLQKLPETLGNLAKLHYFVISFNRLQQLPDKLRLKFGEAWCRRTLESQMHPTPQPVLLPGYAAARAQAQRANPPENTEESLTNNIAKLKLN